MRAERTRPGVGTEAGNERSAGRLSVSVPQAADAARLNGWDALAAQVRGAFVVIVTVPTGRHRRRVFLTVKAAEDAARRAAERGQLAEVVLAELHPVFHVGGGEAP